MTTARSNRDQLQARLILSRGWMDQGQLLQFMQSLPADSPSDLCAHLLARGLLNVAQASEARRASAQAFDTVRQRASDRLRSPTGSLSRPAGASRPHEPMGQALALRPQPGSLLQQPSGTLPAAGSGEQTGLRALIAATAPAPAGSAEISGELANPTQSLRPGARFQHYTLERELSRGAMGVIMLARSDDQPDRVLALKFIQQNAPDETEVARFRREAATLISLRHENIIEIFDVGAEGGRLFYAMEFVRGTDLFQLVTQSLRETGQPPDQDSILKYIIELASALEYCHEHQVVHRDVKPQNLLIEDETERAVLVDFGLMKRNESSDSKGLTKTGEIVGTPAFMAPEQFSPGGSFGGIGPCSDVWALAATLYFALVGEPPFPQTTVVEIFQAITVDNAPRLRTKRPDAPLWLDELIRDALIKDSTARPTMTEMRERLERGRGSLRVGELAEQRTQGILPKLALLLIPLAAFLIALPFLQNPIQLVAPIEAPEWTSRESEKISVRVNQPGIELRLGALQAKSDALGRAEFNVPTTKAENRFILRAADKVLSELTIRLDSNKPKIRLGDWPGTDPIPDSLNCDLSGQLTGQVLDECPRSLTWGARAVALNTDGSFVLDIPNAPRAEPITLIAEDAAGRSTQIELKVASLRAQELQNPTLAQKLGFERFCKRIGNKDRAAILEDLQQWRRSSTEGRLAAAQLIASRLSQDYKLLGLESFRCGSLENELGVFEHKPSKLRLILLPGSLQTEKHYADPIAGMELQLLDRIIESRSKKIFLSALYYFNDLSQSSDSFIDDLLSHFNLLSRKSDITGNPKSKMDLSDLLFEERYKKRFIEWCQSRRDKHRNIETRSLQRYLEPFLVADQELEMSSYKLFMPIPILNFDSASPAAQFDIFATPRDELPVFLTLALANEWAKKVGMRLPSHSEWIYASRAGATTRFYWGDKHSDSPPHYINDGDIDNEGEKSMSFPRSRESSAGTANAFGLYNTLGNVCEWVQASSIPWREAFPEGISPSNRLTKSFDSWGAVCGGGVFQAVRIFDHELLQLAPDPENNNPGLAPRGLRPAASIP